LDLPACSRRQVAQADQDKHGFPFGQNAYLASGEQALCNRGNEHISIALPENANAVQSA